MNKRHHGCQIRIQEEQNRKQDEALIKVMLQIEFYLKKGVYMKGQISLRNESRVKFEM